MEWTLDRVDKNAILVARYFREDLEMHPIDLIDRLERIYSPGKLDGTDLEVVSGNAVLTGDPSVFFPLDMLEGYPTRISLPVLVFNVLFGHPSHLCYVWSRLRHLRTVDEGVLGIIHRALFVVGEWYADLASNPPVIDLAMGVGRPDLRMLVARLAYVLRLATGSLLASTDLLRQCVFVPWHMWGPSPFWEMVERVLVQGVICVEMVQLASQNPPVVRSKDTVKPDFFFNGNVGLVICPRDKIVLTAVLLFSEEINLVKRATLDTSPTLRDLQVPKPLTTLVTKLAAVYRSEVKPPPHHADHYPELRGDPGRD